MSVGMIKDASTGEVLTRPRKILNQKNKIKKLSWWAKN